MLRLKRGGYTGIFARVITAAVSDGRCPLRRRCVEEYLASVPQGKYISIDVPADIFELDKVMSVAELRVVVKYLNETRGRRVRLRVPWWKLW